VRRREVNSRFCCSPVEKEGKQPNGSSNESATLCRPARCVCIKAHKSTTVESIQ